MICKHGDKCDCYNENMYPCNHDDMVKCVYYKNGGYNDMVVGTDDEKYRAIIDHYGEPAQVLKAIEEMAELIRELTSCLKSNNLESEVILTKVFDCADHINTLSSNDLFSDTLEMGDDSGNGFVMSECADVENMLSQLRIIFGSWEDKRVEKLDRTMERIRK